VPEQFYFLNNPSTAAQAEGVERTVVVIAEVETVAVTAAGELAERVEELVVLMKAGVEAESKEAAEEKKTGRL
jgi:hypothetical protein